MIKLLLVVLVFRGRLSVDEEGVRVFWSSGRRDSFGEHVVVLPLPSDRLRRERIGGHCALEVGRIPFTDHDALGYGSYTVNE